MSAPLSSLLEDGSTVNGNNVDRDAVAFSTAISLKRIADYLQPTTVVKAAAPAKPGGLDDDGWFDRFSMWMTLSNSDLIEVRYFDDGIDAPTKLYLGEAIEWSTWKTGPLTLKQSIERWRPVLTEGRSSLNDGWNGKT
jgi:hypothetical protein